MKKLMILALAAFAVTVTNADDKDYLSFTAQGGQVSISMVGASDFSKPDPISFEISYDKDNWSAFTAGETSKSVSSGKTIYFRLADDANIDTLGGNVRFSFYSSTYGATVAAGGNVMSLLSKDLTATSLGEKAFSGLFSNCKLLTVPPKLPATTLAARCYSSMFGGCTSLMVAPELPATSLEKSCYYGMFSQCSSLIAPPKLPATSLRESCYYGMFSQCTSLTTAPRLPAMALADECYRSMFWGCSSLTVPPELPATTLKPWCYAEMFRACTALATPPCLAAMELAEHCYRQMFYETGLTTAPSLPALSLKKYCYDAMFYRCPALATAPELPAISLAQCCYRQMFYYCTTLRQAVVTGTVVLGDSLECTEIFKGSKSSGRLISFLTDMTDNSYWKFPSEWDLAYASNLVKVSLPKVTHLTTVVSNQYGVVSGELSSGGVTFNLLKGDAVTINLVADDGWEVKGTDRYAINSISDSVVFGTTQGYPSPDVFPAPGSEEYAAIQEKLRAAEFATVVVTTVSVDGQAMSYADYKAKCWEYGVAPLPEPRIVASDEVAVKQTELQAAKAETVSVADGVVSLAVGVCSNGNFQAEAKDWKPITLVSDNVKVLNGRIVITLPVGGNSGFMVLQSGDGRIHEWAQENPDGAADEEFYGPTVK